MTPSEFLRRFLFHVTAAADAVAALFLVAEFLAPGSVLPFVGLVDLLIPLIVLNVIAAMLVPRKA
ncbi:hypothetical protein L0Y59_03010 [Candidatus Uhrbacteria bacterium]|nr:hypothetical protein [Candidatus Uhrbacteria bacterium]